MPDSAKTSTKVQATAKRAIAFADSVHESAWFERAARAGFAVNGLLHILIGALAISVALGAGVDDADPGGALSAVAQTPGGLALVWVLAVGLAALTLLLIAAGIAVIGIGGYFVVKGARRTFLDDVVEGTGASKDAIVVLGTVGYIAKGISLGALGALLVVTAVTVDPSTAGGLDEALRSLTELPFGVVLLMLVALGLIAYGVYCGVRARRASL